MPPCLSFLIQVISDPQVSFTKKISQRVFLMLKNTQDPTPLGAPFPPVTPATAICIHLSPVDAPQGFVLVTDWLSALIKG